MKQKVLFVLAAIFIAALVVYFSTRPRADGRQEPVAQAQPSARANAPAPLSTAASSPALATRAATEQKALLRPAGTTWENAGDAPEFSVFVDWTERFRAATSPEERAELEAEGVAVAQDRRNALAQLIQSDPKRALELAVPFGVRQTLPKAVEELLEERVSARADVMVIGAIPLPGRENEIKPITRSTIIGKNYYDTYSFGWWLDHQISTYNAPVNGIALTEGEGRLLALSPHPVRLPDDSEESAVLERKALGLVCSISGDLATIRNEKTVVEVAGQAMLTCGLDHAAAMDAQLIESASMAESASIIGGPPLVGYDNYTTGRKRFLIMRPGFSDLTNTMADGAVTGHFNSFSNFMYTMSFGKLIFAGLGQGSDATPIMRLPGVAADYDNTGLGKLYNTCKGVAETNYGFNIAQYDFLYVVTGGQPAASYAGLGFVRGVGFHLANSYYGAGTAAHEYGHNLGLNHANFWSTLGTTILGVGNSIEYGDGNDPMGAAGTSPQDFNSRYKNYLTWIQDSDVAVISSGSSGTYRLYSLDLADTPGYLRGLKVARSGSQNYWVQFRETFAGKATQNGVQLLWTGNGNQSSLLLDTRLKDGSSDNALVIGRTFSDTALGIHITPIGRAHTYPESIDVVVNVGTFAGNQPPICTVSANSTTASAGQSVSFHAAATDANGDALAYYWEFGDGDYSVDNSPNATHSFASAGEYVIQCAVSDRKGGTGRDSVVVRVGSPATFRISGRVLKLDQTPLSGVEVAADATHSAVTDSDGTYSITGLGSGNYTVEATEPVSGSPTFIHPFFSNPVTVGPSAINMNFIVGTAAPPVTLVAQGAVWKYLDNGSNQGTDWRTAGFNDSAWASGAAQLGYGEGDEATVISFGGNAAAKYTTTYFRRGFNVADPAVLTNLTVSLLRDDGGIVYLNGIEIFRSNMPTGAVTYTTFASGAIDDQVFFSEAVSNAVLQAGANTIAVEIHQADPGSSDVSFDLKLGADDTGVAPQGTLVYLTTPEANSVLATPTNLTLNAVAVSTLTIFTNVQFFDGSTKLGEDDSTPFTFDWNNVPLGSHAFTARARNTNGQTVISAAVNISVVAASAVPPAVTLSLIQTGAFWKYLAVASSAPTTWPNRDFDDSLWPGGRAQLGYGEGDETTPISYGGNVNNKWITSYYRYPFTINDPGAVTNLTLHLKRDDGAVVYVNGLEILRDNLPPGPVTWGTLATNAADDGQVFVDFTLDPATLTPGTNIVAVELHQAAANSSDASFDLALDGLASTNRPRGVYLTSPRDGSIVPPGLIVITAQVVAGGTLGVTNVEFFGDGLKVGEDASAPFSVVWPDSPSGAHQIYAVATDSAGGSITSSPVSIVLAAERPATDLVSWGEIWKFLDDGSVPAAAWRSRTFNDSSWDEGWARLGYGGDGESTTVSFGNDPNNKHITTYFRQTFMVGSPNAFSAVQLRLIRDDGAVVYLNGVEVFRSNMATGLISANSLALTTVNPPEETEFFETTLSPTSLLAGSNVLAVEIHQASINSSDLGFDLALLGLTGTNLVQGVYLASPGNGAQYQAPATLSLSAVVVSTGAVSKVEFFAGPNKIGEKSGPPYNFSWASPPVGLHLLAAVATETEGRRMTSPAVNITIETDALPIASIATLLVSSHASWTYLDNGSNQGSNWTTRAFNDSGWKTGVARFGHGLDGEFTRISNNITTHYFRKWFTVTNAAIFTELLFRLERDDGAVVHLNGQEIYRSNMPTGAVSYATLAATTANSLDENYVFETFIATVGSGLMLGSNLVAVELHQAATASSDAGFDLELWGLGNTEPRVYLSNPAEGAVVALPVQIDAQAWPGMGRSISKVEFFDGVTKLGEASAAPFSFVWQNASPGTHGISAAATDSGGRIVPSEAITISVFQPPLNTTLVATGSVWKYLDNGSNQGTNWSQRNYDDGTWASGPAELGYGNAPVTIVSFGPDPNNRYITTYFRHWFFVPADAVYTNLNFGLKRDDGAVVYLNGVEMFRSNMPNGTITFTNLASSAVVVPDEQTFFPTSLRASNLVAGANLLAVEVHQNAAASGDLGFDIALVGAGYALPAAPPTLVVQRNGPEVKVSWPINVAGWRMYSANTLTPAGWSFVTTPPKSVNGFNVLTVNPTNEAKFYQLRKP